MIAADSELTARSFASLLDLMIEHEDRVPRSVIEECARRGSVAIAALHRLVYEERWVRGALAPGDWWLRLHAAMILGLIPEDGAGTLLIDLLRRADVAGDEALQKWLCGYWPALMRNKSEAAIAAARALAADRSAGWNARAEAARVVIARAEAEGEAVLGHALDWAAGIAFDEADDIEVRAHVGAAMLEHPRAQDRARLEALADAQPYRIRMFDRGDVEWAYSDPSVARSHRPEQQADPWSFYSPEAIAERQRRWAREAVELAGAEFDPPGQAPFVRSAPKIARNDPCPCGSGKKYKKCCLGAPGAAS